MTSIYLGKICVIFSELLFLNVIAEMKMLFYFIKLPMKDLFFSEKCPFCYLIIGGCPFFSKQVYRHQLRSSNPTNRKKHLFCKNSGLPHYLEHNLAKLTSI